MDNLLDKIRDEFSGSYDLVERELLCGNQEVYLFFMLPLCDRDYISSYIIKPLTEYSHRSVNKETINQLIQSTTLTELKSFRDVKDEVLFGNVVAVIPDLSFVFSCNSRSINSRAIEKSDIDASIKGSKESFNEVLHDNIGLIRKRIASPHLKIHKYIVGTKSNTSVAVLYLSDSAPKDLVKHVCEKIKNMDSEFILATNYIAEELKTDRTGFDTAGFFDKPDTVSSLLCEGRIAIIANGTPFVLTVPYFFMENFQSSDDYYSNIIEGSLIRIMRIASLLISLLLPALYVVLTTVHHSLIPTTFVFKLAVSRAGVPLPTVVEMVIMQFFFELAREAGKRLPMQIGQSMSVVAGLILGESAVGMGLASQATVVITGVYAICTFINSKLLSTVFRWSLLITSFSVVFGLHGFYIGFLLFIAQLSSIRSVGYPYLFPFGTVRTYKSGLHDVLWRGHLSKISKNFLIKKGSKKS